MYVHVYVWVGVHVCDMYVHVCVCVGVCVQPIRQPSTI